MLTDSIKLIGKPICASVIALALGACGGGSGGPSTGDTLPAGAPGATLVTGSLVDAPVNGVSYRNSASTRSGVTGATGTAGQFTVEQGDTVSFRLGNLVLGTSQAITANGQIVTPAELAGNRTNFNDPRAIRIAQVLQSLDRDRNTGNGIDIDAAVATRLSDGTVNSASLQTAIDTGTNFASVFGGMVDELTAGNAGRVEGEIVSVASAKNELADAVALATGANPRDVLGGEPIVAATQGACPAGVLASARLAMFGQSFPVCVLNQDITGNVTLSNDHVYVLQKAVKVGDGDAAGGPSGTANAVLTVEPGTQIFGYNGLQTGLIITRGSRINAQGTADLPIVMAAVEATGVGSSVQITDDPADLTKRGQWAGLVLSGAGQDNFCTGSNGSGNLFSEAAPTGSQRYFGCNNNADTSGTVEYVVIAESGLGFRPDQEVQGLTLEGVGSGTRINYLQVLGSEDDGIEWFGGAASASNVVINGVDDDGLDFDEGIQATVQRALVIMGSANGDKGIEADNAGPNDDATPTSRVNFVNLTVLGAVGSGGGSKGANLREGFGGRLYRSAFVDAPGKAFGRGCLDFDNEVDEYTELRDVVVGCVAGSGTGGVLGDGNATGTAFINSRTREDGTAAAEAVDFAAFSGTINTATLALSAGTPDNPGTLPAAVNGTAIGNYFGAVDPSSGNPDQDPNNNGAGGGPFWDGWTYINAAVDGGLPGANFHPLEAEIRPIQVSLVSGTLVDAAVNGVDYQGSGGTRSGVTGATGTAGQFTVEQGDRVTFRLGNLLLGTSLPITANGQIVTPAELAGNEAGFDDPRAIRIARVLQSLDRDRNTANGIDIDAAVATRLSDGTVNSASLQTAIDTGTNFASVFGGMVDELSAGNANRAQNEIVSEAAARVELVAAVNQDTGQQGPAVAAIVPATQGACPAGVLASARLAMFGQSFPVCVLNQDITGNVTLSNDHVYVLQKAVKVGDGDAVGGPSGTANAVLTVEPGTQIFGYNGLQTGLIITRGSRINAQGTADLPIVMAAVEATGVGSSVQITDDPADLTKRGQWAGLVLSGAGQDNFCTGSNGSGNLFSEAAPTGSQRYFGCNNNADTSGTVEYVVIAESGLGFRPDQEVQGLTLEGVGSGTRINYLQVLGSEDDGIEWFGGAASASNVVINGVDDDGLDFDEGIQATVQRALVVMGSANGDKGIEADNAGPNDDATPTSRVNFVNLTVLGAVGAGGGSKGANLREGFGGRLYRAAFVDAPGKAFGRGCLDFDNEVDEFTELRDVVVGCVAGTGAGGVLADGNAVGTAYINSRTREDGTAAAEAVDFAAFSGTINTATLAISAGTPDNPGTLPAAVNGTAIGNYFGAVDPSSGNPDQDPNNNGAGGGPFWDGWTYINAAVDGGLPGANFHPLQKEIE